MRKPSYVIFCVALLLVGGCASPATETDTSAPVEQASKWVEAYKVASETKPIQFAYAGVVEPTREIELSFGSPGEIAQLALKKGDKVKKGQLLASLDGKAQQIAVQVAAEQANMAAIMKNEAGKGSSAEAIGQQNLRLTSEQQNLAEAKKALAQGEALFQGGAISKSERDNFAVRVQQIENSVKQQQLALQELQKGPSANQVAQAQSSLAQAQGQVSQARESIQLGKIVAPFDGTVVEIYEETGKLVQPGQQIMKVVDLSNVTVALSIDQSEIGMFSVGKNLSVQSGTGESVTGTITFISPVVDQKTGKFRVEVTVPNKEGFWRGGMMATIELPVAVNGVMIPLECVGMSNESHYVMKVVNGKVEKAKVQTGKVMNGHIEILSGITNGDLLVNSGITSLMDGERVSVKGES
ncbi:efflux RND transporter periplasmic adaptor subunit [Brevibacillus daliensis]|uniref:efflux RND transporter periplasmic adaptor subunit n=1 Tax=Brevibacillus daliensis TaxID=2892995 RepID=UPI001E5683BF|nr:efflux RND transporter periplasmic adaptor subunit [Brevibacillus daliensis]